MPDRFLPFAQPPSVKGLPKLLKPGPEFNPGMFDVLGEAFSSPMGFGTTEDERAGMNPDARSKMMRAGAMGDLLTMLLPMGLAGQEAGAVKTALRTTKPLNLSEIPSLREFAAVGSEAPFVRGQGADLALKLARKQFPNAAPAKAF